MCLHSIASILFKLQTIFEFDANETTNKGTPNENFEKYAITCISAPFKGFMFEGELV